MDVMKKIFLFTLFFTVGELHLLAAEPTATATDEKIKGLEERVKKVEATKFRKTLMPAKDVAYLCELTESKNSAADQICKCENSAEPCDFIQDLAKVEQRLFNSAKTGEPIERINRAYDAVKYEDWQSDQIRFGVYNAYLINPVTKASFVAASVALHGYFSYRRFIPGNFDLGRRFSYFFAIGAPYMVGDNVKISSPVFSTGLGIDLVKGITFSVGGSVYGVEDAVSKTSQVNGAISVGITLNTDLARALSLF